MYCNFPIKMFVFCYRAESSRIKKVWECDELKQASLFKLLFVYFYLLHFSIEMPKDTFLLEAHYLLINIMKFELYSEIGFPIGQNRHNWYQYRHCSVLQPDLLEDNIFELFLWCLNSECITFGWIFHRKIYFIPFFGILVAAICEKDPFLFLFCQLLHSYISKDNGLVSSIDFVFVNNEFLHAWRFFRAHWRKTLQCKCASWGSLHTF